MHKIILLLITLATTGCETFHGVHSTTRNFPKLIDKSCITSAIKKTPNVEFIRADVLSSKAKTFWYAKDIFENTFRFEYNILPLNETAFVMVHESSSIDPNYNFIHFGQIFGRANGNDYPEEKKSIAKESFEKVSLAVSKECQIEPIKETYY